MLSVEFSRVVLSISAQFKNWVIRTTSRSAALLALAGDRAGRCDSRAKGAPNPSGWECKVRQNCRIPQDADKDAQHMLGELSAAGGGYCQWDCFPALLPGTCRLYCELRHPHISPLNSESQL